MTQASKAGQASGAAAVTRFLRPRTVAIVGMSARPGAAGQNVYSALKLNGFTGDIHFVGRSAEPIDGRPVLSSTDQLPEGIDLAVFCMPAAGVKEAVEGCVRRGTRSALIFA